MRARSRESWAAYEGAAGSRQGTLGCGQWELYHESAFLNSIRKLICIMPLSCYKPRL